MRLVMSNRCGTSSCGLAVGMYKTLQRFIGTRYNKAISFDAITEIEITLA